MKNKPKPILNEYLVAEKIRQDYRSGLILSKEALINRILFHDEELCRTLGSSKAYSKRTIENSTLSRFLKKYELPTPTAYFQSMTQLPMKKVTVINANELDEGCSTIAPTESDFNMKSSDDKIPSRTTTTTTFDQIFEAEDENENNLIIQYQGEKIKELNKICCGLSNKIPPSALLNISSYPDSGELEQNRTLHLCIRGLIQVISPIKQITEWIIENDFLIIKDCITAKEEEDDPFRQLANTWFWDGILKYESLEDTADKFKTLKRIGHRIKELCERNDTVFGTTTTTTTTTIAKKFGLFVPPSPQKILDMIIQQHYNHFLDDMNLGELPNLPFKKIQLVPPRNIKPFATVSFRNWRPALQLQPNGFEDNEYDEIIQDQDRQAEEEEEVLFAELTWDKDKLTYIHFAWPSCEEEDVILEKGWYYYAAGGGGDSDGCRKVCCKSDYQMVGVIWGRKFIGDWAETRQDRLVPQLGGIDQPPATYIYATKRGTNSNNPKQGRWFLCLDDNYVSSFRPLMLTNNFQDVLLYMDNNQRRTYRPQLFVFQNLKNNNNTSTSPHTLFPSSPPLHKLTHQTANTTLASSPKRKACTYDQTNSLASQFERKTSKKVLTNPPPPKGSDTTTKKCLLSKPDRQLTSKKSIIEIIDILCDSTSIMTKETDLERFFGFEKASDYQKGPSGFQINQTEDQKRYYAALANLKKKNY
jgi:hypothetical protein